MLVGTSRSSAPGLVRAQAAGRPWGVATKCRCRGPQEAGVGGAVSVAGPPGQLGSLDGGAAAGALDGGGVDQTQAVVPYPGGSCQGGDEPGHGGEGAQALVEPRLARDAGEHACQVLAGVAQSAPLAGVAQ